MKTATIFDFLSAQNLLVPFIKENKVLQDLEKEDLLLLVEKLLNPEPKTFADQLQEVVEQTKALNENHNFVVDNNYRKHEVQLSLQDVLNKLNKDGVIPRGSMSKASLNKIAHTLGIVDFKVRTNSVGYPQKCWFPTEKGESLGVTQKYLYGVAHSLTSYDYIKDFLLSK